ncbi:MAG: hypothetical protein AAF629_31270 [Chloroflexota bacterium]
MQLLIVSRSKAGWEDDSTSAYANGSLINHNDAFGDARSASVDSR